VTDLPPPSDLAAETAVLSAVLASAEALDEVRGCMRPHDMFSTANRYILEAALKLDEAGKHVDVVSVTGALHDAERLNAVGGVEALARLVDEPLSPTAIETHCRTIADKARVRRMIATAYQIAAEGYAPHDDMDAWLHSAEQAVFDAAEDGRSVGKTESIQPLVLRVMAEIEARGEDSMSGVDGIWMPWRSLAGVMPTLRLGKVHVVAGRPGMGKTAFATELARLCAGPDCGVLILSLEMTKDELVQRLLAAEAVQNVQTIMEGEPAADDWPGLTAAAERLRALPIAIRHCPGAAVSLLRATVRREAARMNRAGVPLKLVIVDYLQLLAGNRRKGDSRDTEVGDISRGLVSLAGEFHVAVIAVSQLNREVEKRPNKRPQLSDLRESGAIEQDAYSVTFLYRDDYYDEHSKEPGVAEVRVAKHRNGRTGTARLRFVGESCRFDDIEDPDDGYSDLDAPDDSDRRHP